MYIDEMIYQNFLIETSPLELGQQSSKAYAMSLPQRTSICSSTWIFNSRWLKGVYGIHKLNF